MELRVVINRSIEMAKWYIPQIMRNKTVKLYWWRDFPNIGDRVSPHIVQHFSGTAVLPVSGNARNKLLSCGSVLHYAQDDDKIWGSGVMSTRTELRTRNMHVFSVRGPLTRNFLLGKGIGCPECYGDPALLLPMVFPQDKCEKQWEVGVVPHYVDLKYLKLTDPKVKVLDVRRPLKVFLKDLWQCERVVSSSLHGIIFAEAYGIPAAWIELSGEVVGGGFKFRDYYLGTDREPILPLKKNALLSERAWVAPKFDLKALITSFCKAVERL